MDSFFVESLRCKIKTKFNERLPSRCSRQVPGAFTHTCITFPLHVMWYCFSFAIDSAIKRNIRPDVSNCVILSFQWSAKYGSRCEISEVIINLFDYAWWRHQMETFSALLALCAGNSPVPVNSTHKGQWRGALMFTLICAGINDWVNNREAGDLRRHLDHYDVSVMGCCYWSNRGAARKLG